jgi:threonine dehydrogenase-like Zn-dependent dehydrogenase
MPMIAEYNVVDLDMIFKIPEGGSTLQYCIAEPFASAMRGIDIADIQIGDSVLISGVGGIGAILLDMLTKRGVTKLTASDPLPQKRERALAMGAQYVIDPSKEDIVKRGMEITEGRGYDKIIEASGVPAAAPPMLDLIAKKGKVVYFAVFPMDYELPVNLYELYMKEASIHTVYTTIYNYPRVMDLIPYMQTDKIIGPVYDLDDAVEAFEAYKRSEYPKIVIKCNKDL